MDEQVALSLLADELDGVGDDAAVFDGLVLTTDMLHETTDFPTGTTRYTAGWRSVGASLSDVAAMGAEALAAVGVYAAPFFEQDELIPFVRGASDVSELVGAEYVGGDLDRHDEFTISTAVVGRTDNPIGRTEAKPEDAVCVTGTLGRTAAALRHFKAGCFERGNELFRFDPRIETGRVLESYATAMMDSSDGLARSLHQLASASDCGFSIDSEAIPIDESVSDVTSEDETALSMATKIGEDFELVATVPNDALEEIKEKAPVTITRIGTTTRRGVEIDGEPLQDTGYSHGK